MDGTKILPCVSLPPSISKGCGAFMGEKGEWILFCMHWYTTGSRGYLLYEGLLVHVSSLIDLGRMDDTREVQLLMRLFHLFFHPSNGALYLSA